MTEKGAGLYRKGWASWLKFLHATEDEAGQAVPWYAAQGSDVLRFLQSGLRNRKAGVPVSEITRRRYFRMLERIYDYALHQGWVNSNPALQIHEKERPPSETYQGAVLMTELWHAALALLPSERDKSNLGVRNRALLLCLFHLGLMPQEVRALTIEDVLRKTDDSAGRHGRVTALQLDGPGPNQRRRLAAPLELADALEVWCEVRSAYRGARDNNILFCSSHGRQMTSENLLFLCRGLLLRAAAATGLPPPPRLGPQIVRNTSIVMWLNSGVAPAEVVSRAGLKDIKALLHLREAVHESVRSSISKQADDQSWRSMNL